MSDHQHCHCHAAPPTANVFETLDELDFRRGLWSSAQQNDIDEFRQRLSTIDSKSIDKCDASGYTPLHYAVRHRPPTICRLLLEHGANPNCQTRASLSTAIHRAITFENIEAIRLLIDYHADLNLKDIDGLTPMDKALKLNNEQIVNILLTQSKK